MVAVGVGVAVLVGVAVVVVVLAGEVIVGLAVGVLLGDVVAGVVVADGPPQAVSSDNAPNNSTRKMLIDRTISPFFFIYLLQRNEILVPSNFPNTSILLCVPPFSRPPASQKPRVHKE